MQHMMQGSWLQTIRQTVRMPRIFAMLGHDVLRLTLQRMCCLFYTVRSHMHRDDITGTSATAQPIPSGHFICELQLQLAGFRLHPRTIWLT